jgi:hypothetical protein
MRLLCMGIINGGVKTTVIPDHQNKRIRIVKETVSRPAKRAALKLIPLPDKRYNDQLDIPEFMKPRPRRSRLDRIREWFKRLRTPKEAAPWISG